MADTGYKTLKELDGKYMCSDTSEAFLYKEIKNKLIENGFGLDLSSLSKFLDDNPFFMSHCNKIKKALLEHNSALVIIDTSQLLWEIHKYFPLIYALNSPKGESIFKISLKHLLDSLLDKDISAEMPSRINKDLVMIGNIFSGDNRISSMSSSLEGIIEPLIFSRKVVFTAHTLQIIPSKIKEDTMYKLRTFYSPAFEQTFQFKVTPVIIQTCESKKSLWED
jgi:hypothetical protein